RRLSDHDLGGADMQDIIAGGRWLVKEGHCAPDRLGAIGTSYGGYSVAHVLEKAPDLWAVGVSIVGYFNWMTATTNERGYLQQYDRQKMGHPDTLGCPSSRPGSSSRAADRARPRCRYHARPSAAARDGPGRPREEG